MRFVLPGMGATSAMYSGPWRSLPATAFVDWPPAVGDITFTTIAADIIREHQIGSEDSMIGTSLGGMIALEIARQVAVLRGHTHQ